MLNTGFDSRPAPLLTDGSNPFAHNTIKVRIPAVISEVLALNPDYPAPIQRALEILRQNLIDNALIPMLDLPAPDYDEWAASCADHAESTWLNSEWFFAEVFFYRHLIQAVQWWETGRDPFAPKKAEELADPALWSFLELALATQPDPVDERLATLLQYTLWGNRIDLSYAASRAHGRNWTADDLIADDTSKAVEQLLARRGTVHIISDNTGTELAADLALTDALLETVAERVIIHLKMHPTFVSDTTVPDALAFLDQLSTRSGNSGTLAVRLHDAITEGRLRLAPDLYWNSSRWFWELPPRLTKTFDGASLVIVKGDANYRRIVGDAIWEPAMPFASVLSYFPAPLLALRSLKSDTLAGLRPGLAAELDALEADWRVNGRRGVIQFSAGLGHL